MINLMSEEGKNLTYKIEKDIYETKINDEDSIFITEDGVVSESNIKKFSGLIYAFTTLSDYKRFLDQKENR